MLRQFILGISIGFLMFVIAPDAQADEFDRPALSEFLMDRDREIALARSAAPDRVSKDATVMVLGENGYETVIEGTNSFVCLVLRSWGNPTYDHAYAYKPGLIVPECLDANAVKTILPIQLYRAELGVRMTPPAKIEASVKKGFRNGRFRRTESVSFSYMLSTAMSFGDGHQGPAHIMIYLPDNYDNVSVGGFPYRERFIIVEGGPNQPFVAANIYLPDSAVEPVFD